MTDDFLRWALTASMTAGEFVLDELDRSMETLLTERSRGGAAAGAAGVDGLMSASSGNRENQLSEAITASPWNMGDVS